jgi:hypothetical protein
MVWPPEPCGAAGWSLPQSTRCSEEFDFCAVVAAGPSSKFRPDDAPCAPSATVRSPRRLPAGLSFRCPRRADDGPSRTLVVLGARPASVVCRAGQPLYIRRAEAIGPEPTTETGASRHVRQRKRGRRRWRLAAAHSRLSHWSKTACATPKQGAELRAREPPVEPDTCESCPTRRCGPKSKLPGKY